MSYRPVSAVVLAAGEGSRMRSSRPKPLHLLCGRPMLLYILDALSELPIDRTVVVVGHGAEEVIKRLNEQAPVDSVIDFVEQHVQRGTGDAVGVALTAFPDDDLNDGDIVVLPGDTPLLRPSTLAALVHRHRETEAAASMLTARLENPTGYGRVLRGKDDRVRRVVEHADASDEERAVDEINTSIYCFRRSLLAPTLRRLSPENAQGEYYLTDVVEVLHDAGHKVVTLVADDEGETVGVNDRAQLADAESELRLRTNRRWLSIGVTMLDPERTYIDATVELGRDVTLFPDTLLQGRTVVGEGAEIGPNTRLVDTIVGAGARVEMSVARDAEIGAGAVVGPFASLEPGDQVAPGFRTGPFYTPARDDHTSDD